MTTLPKGYILHGTYKIESVLGQGGFAITYEARHANLGTRHAIKEYFPKGVAERHGNTVYPAAGADNRRNFAKGISSFLREAQTLTKFSHPNIVAIHDYFPENGTAYLVMPYLVGETLEQALKKQPGSKISSQAMKKWLLPLLDGLAMLHKNRFLHRDIKPSNIYLTENATPILIDFGAARSALGQLTHGFTVVFTPEYAPPEQYTALASSQGPWTDIYALGAVMFRCLLGAPPPDANARQLAVINGGKDPVELAYDSLAAASDASMAKIVTRCLDLNSKTRVRSVAELQNLLSGKAASPEAGKAKRPRLDKRALIDWLLAALIIASALAFIYFFMLPRFAPQLASNSPQTPSTSPQNQAPSPGAQTAPRKASQHEWKQEWKSFALGSGAAKFVITQSINEHGDRLYLTQFKDSSWLAVQPADAFQNLPENAAVSCSFSINNGPIHTSPCNVTRLNTGVSLSLPALDINAILLEMRQGQSLALHLYGEDLSSSFATFSLRGFDEAWKDAAALCKKTFGE